MPMPLCRMVLFWNVCEPMPAGVDARARVLPDQVAADRVARCMSSSEIPFSSRLDQAVAADLVALDQPAVGVVLQADAVALAEADQVVADRAVVALDDPDVVRRGPARDR